MTIRNCVLAIFDQLTQKGALRNIFVTHNAFGIFSQYSHISRRSGKPKMAYPSKATAMKAAEAMGKKHGVHFSVYKCARCDGWHIGKNAQNKISSETEVTLTRCVFIQKPNAFYETLKQYPIVDLAPVYDRGVRGRTMSGRGNNWLLGKVKDAGIKVIIDLRTADYTDRYNHNVEEAGLEYHSIPIDSKATDAHQIIALLPLLFQLLDNGNFFMACAMGRHRTDIALALYYVFHPTIPYNEIPEMKGHRKDGQFHCDDIAARLNSVMNTLDPETLSTLGLPDNYEHEFRCRKKLLFERNKLFT